MEVDDNNEEDNLFDYLPNEVILKIFSFMDLDDLKTVRLTCQRLKMLANDGFAELSTMFWDNENLEDFICNRDSMVNSNTKFESMRFEEVNFDQISYEDFEKIFSRNLCVIEHLAFDKCTLDDVWVLKLLKCLPRLVALMFECLDPVKNSISYSKFISAAIDRIGVISLNNFQYLDRQIIDAISLDIKPKLEVLYLREIGMNRFKNPFKSSGIHHLLKLVAKNLKILVIDNQTPIPNLLSTFNELDLNLEELELQVDDGVFDFDFKIFFGSQTNLAKLLIEGDGITDERAKFLCKKLIKLESLEIQSNNIISTEGFKCVALLRELKEFVVIGCSNLWNAGVREGIAKQKNDLLSLSLSGQLCNDTLVAAITNLKQLTKLHLDTTLYFSPGLIPLIYENLPHLTDLHVGQEVTLSRRPPQACLVEHQLIPPSLLSKDSRITLLKDLAHLSFSGYSRLPGASLEDIAKLMELETLTLKSCWELSVKGFKGIFEDCDYIELISIGGCNEFIANETEKAEFISCYPPQLTFIGL